MPHLEFTDKVLDEMNLESLHLVAASFKNAVEIMCLAINKPHSHITSTLAQKVQVSTDVNDFVEMVCYLDNVKQFFVRLYGWRLVYNE